MNIVVKASLFYGLWIALHFLAAHMYTEFCVPMTLKGFLLSSLVSPSPHCTGLRWAINAGGDAINAMWFAFGTAVIAIICKQK